jgi:glycosyltransferase involved in cell wall biosynthesis
VGFAGRLIPGKGTDHLIRALAQVDERIHTKLLIAGDGPEYERLVALAQSLHVEPKIEFLGVVDDLSEYWQRCDVAAVPSDAFIESFSMVTLEAMACGRPIVATRNGAIPELIVDGVTGTLVPPGNVDALARALLAYAERPEMRHAHGAAARTRAIERFLIDDCARAYLDLFGEFATSPTYELFPSRTMKTTGLK